MEFDSLLQNGFNIATKLQKIIRIIKKRCPHPPKYSKFCCIFAKKNIFKRKIPTTMTQLVLNIEDKSMLAPLKKIISSMKGVSIAPTVRKRKTGIEEAMDDIAAGRIYHANSVDEMFDDILGK